MLGLIELLVVLTVAIGWAVVEIVRLGPGRRTRPPAASAADPDVSDRSGASGTAAEP